MLQIALCRLHSLLVPVGSGMVGSIGGLFGAEAFVLKLLDKA